MTAAPPSEPGSAEPAPADPDCWALPDGAEADPAFGRLHAYWRARIRDGRLPGRADIRPDEIPADLLPHIVLLAVEAGTGRRRYRIRLFGSGLESMTGSDETGRYYDEITRPEIYAGIARRLDTVIDHGRPLFLAGPSGSPGRDFLLFGRLALPLAADGQTVDMILALVRPLPA